MTRITDYSFLFEQMFVTEETAHLKRKIVSIPESSKEKLFEYTKKTLLKYNGMTASEGNERSEIFLDLQRKTRFVRKSVDISV